MTQQPLPLSDPIRKDINHVCWLKSVGREAEAILLLDALNRIRKAFGAEPITDPEAAAAWGEAPAWARKNG